MKPTVLVALFVCLVTCGNAQQLRMERGFGSVRFYLDSTELVVRQLREVLAKEPMALETFKKAILGATGGFLIGFQIGTLIGGGEPDWAIAAGGAALIVAGIPLQRKSYRQSEESLNLYNSKHALHLRKPEFYLAGTWLKMVIRF
jgi:outer membrane lipoprotein SlyB